MLEGRFGGVEGRVRRVSDNDGNCRSRSRSSRGFAVHVKGTFRSSGNCKYSTVVSSMSSFS